MTHMQRAAELHFNGYNCAQAVAMAFADIVGMSENELCRLTEAFGLGGGCMEGTCGAIAGAQIIIGLLTNEKGEDSSTKHISYKTSRELMQTFQRKNGSVICKELKGANTGRPLRSCHDCVIDASGILEELLGK